MSTALLANNQINTAAMSVTAPSVGAWLRLAREQSGVSLRQIADTTKLTVRVLEAIEHERISHLPPGIYRRPVVRAYAAEVGICPELAVRTFLAQYPDELPLPGTAIPAVEPRSLTRMAVDALTAGLAGVFSFSPLPRR